MFLFATTFSGCGLCCEGPDEEIKGVDLSVFFLLFRERETEKKGGREEE